MVVVTPAEPGPAAAIAVLFEEMGEFYGAAEGGPPEQRVRQIRRMLFDDVRGMSALLAWEDGQLAGRPALYAGLVVPVRTSKLFYRAEVGPGDSG